VLVAVDDSRGVRTIVLNRSEKRNAFNGQLLEDLSRAIADADRDPSVAVILLTASGPAFSAGADFAELEGTLPASDSRRHFDALIQGLTDLSKPLIAAVNGAAAGFGMTILGYADLVFISTKARLRCPFTEFGLAPEAASSYLLPALVGRQNAAWILLSSEWITAQEAHEMGLAWRICEPEDLLRTAERHAAVLARHSVASLAAVKRTMLAPHRDNVIAAHQREMVEFAELRGNPSRPSLSVAVSDPEPESAGPS